MTTFSEDISVLTQTTVRTAEQLISTKGDGIFFIGRSTCPYCRMFAQKLNQAVTETNTQVFFINSQDNPEDLQHFRRVYNIPTVPGFVRIKNGEVSVRCDSSMPIEAIKDFML